MAEPPPVSNETVRSWFTKEIPAAWLQGKPETRLDRDELVVTITLPCPDADPALEGEAESVQQQAILEFREATREERVSIALRAEALYRRQVSWVARCGETTVPFTTLSVPVMTRLRMEQRELLDTLVAAGVARSRSDALSWCVQLVGTHENEWISDLQDAIATMAKLRDRGPV